ncbi:MAG: hypothetical protein ACTSRA_13520 [Promethearchaeota archaeon]
MTSVEFFKGLTMSGSIRITESEKQEMREDAADPKRREVFRRNIIAPAL